MIAAAVLSWWSSSAETSEGVYLGTCALRWHKMLNAMSAKQQRFLYVTCTGMTISILSCTVSSSDTQEKVIIDKLIVKSFFNYWVYDYDIFSIV